MLSYYHFDKVVRKFLNREMVLMHWQRLLEELLELENDDIKAIATQTGLSVNTLRNIQSGKTRYPNRRTRVLLYRLYFKHKR